MGPSSPAVGAKQSFATVRSQTEFGNEGDRVERGGASASRRCRRFSFSAMVSRFAAARNRHGSLRRLRCRRCARNTLSGSPPCTKLDRVARQVEAKQWVGAGAALRDSRASTRSENMDTRCLAGKLLHLPHEAAGVADLRRGTSDVAASLARSRLCSGHALAMCGHELGR
jgi:hypothetical protein